MKAWLKLKLISHYRAISKYTLIGVFCFLVDIFILIILSKYTRIHYLFASAIGYLTGLVINYGFSIKWIFTKRQYKKSPKIEFLIFFTIELIAMLLMSSSLYIFKEFLRIDLRLAKVYANLIAAVWNYALKYQLLFKRRIMSKA